jgi:hypothetical protein
MFLTGSGGTGKSTLLEKIAALVRSEGQICKISAATALAASIYSDATTFHALAGIPVIEECDRELEYVLKLNLSENKINLLLATKVFIIDEAFFLHRECLEAFHSCEKLRGLRGKIILLAGDRKQLIPVVENGTKADQLSVCLSSSEIWKLVGSRIFELKENMRLSKTNNMSSTELQSQLNYASMLEDIGSNTSENTEAFTDDTCQIDEQIYKIKCSQKYVVSGDSDTSSILDSSLSWLYESGFTVDNISSSAVIVGTNKFVDMWNKKIQTMNNGEERLFVSTDYLADIDDDNGHIKKMLSQKFLNSKNHNSAPPHELLLKINDVCILTR